jgi:outer membrane immunogenic protein
MYPFLLKRGSVSPRFMCLAQTHVVSAMKYFKFFAAILLQSTCISSVRADASIDELKARFERAEKENLQLKTEKLERENILMKTAALEQENAKLRSDMGKSNTASLAPAMPLEALPAKGRPTHVAVSPVSYGVTRSRKEINATLDKIPKGDPRRDMSATANLVQVSTVSPIVQNWGGIYLGINGGYGANDVNIYSTSVGYGPGTGGYISNVATPIVSGSATATYFGGPVVGGQIGYNHEFNNHIVIGGELDLDYADINNSHINNTSSWNYAISASNTNISATGVRTGLNWIGTARMRLGYSLGNFLPYITGGLAYGSLSTNGVSATGFGYGYDNLPNNSSTTFLGNASNASYSSLNIGWALGAGAEYKVAENWSVKGEYLYTQLAGLSGSAMTSGAYYSNYYNSGSTPQTVTNQATGPIFTNSTMGVFGIHQARVGLNYHTDWLAAKAPVIAKY